MIVDPPYGIGIKTLRMMNLSLIVIATAAIGALMWTNTATAVVTRDRPLNGIYASISTWKRMNWSDAPHSSLWTAAGWRPHTGTQEFSNSVQVLDGAVSLAGVAFAASVGHGIGGHEGRYVSTLTADVGVCGSALKGLFGIYGVAPRNNSLAVLMKVTPAYAATLTVDRAQWDFGTSRVTAACITNPRNHPSANLQIYFEPIIGAKLLVPPFALRCTGMKLRMLGTERDVTDLALWVDPFSGLILLPDHESFANDAKLSADKLTFARVPDMRRDGQDNHGELQYTINRFTGELNISGSSGGQSMQMTGKCAKSDELKRAF